MSEPERQAFLEIGLRAAQPLPFGEIPGGWGSDLLDGGARVAVFFPGRRLECLLDRLCVLAGDLEGQKRLQGSGQFRLGKRSYGPGGGGRDQGRGGGGFRLGRRGNIRNRHLGRLRSRFGRRGGRSGRRLAALLWRGFALLRSGLDHGRLSPFHRLNQGRLRFLPPVGGSRRDGGRRREGGGFGQRRPGRGIRMSPRPVRLLPGKHMVVEKDGKETQH